MAEAIWPTPPIRAAGSRYGSVAHGGVPARGVVDENAGLEVSRNRSPAAVEIAPQRRPPQPEGRWSLRLLRRKALACRFAGASAEAAQPPAEPISAAGSPAGASGSGPQESDSAAVKPRRPGSGSWRHATGTCWQRSWACAELCITVPAVRVRSSAGDSVQFVLDLHQRVACNNSGHLAQIQKALERRLGNCSWRSKSSRENCWPRHSVQLRRRQRSERQQAAVASLEADPSQYRT